MTSKTEMLMTANHLESRADDAYMEHEDVCMTPREIHALVDDIKAFVRESDRPTCSMEHRPEYSDDELYSTESYQCSECGWIVNEGKPDYCPSCGAEVVDD